MSRLTTAVLLDSIEPMDVRELILISLSDL